MHIPDPIELMESRQEKLMEQYVDEHTCMQCHQRVDYELICPSPIGDGPLLCEECYPVKSTNPTPSRDI